jgi:hypothetical protein
MDRRAPSLGQRTLPRPHFSSAGWDSTKVHPLSRNLWIQPDTGRTAAVARSSMASSSGSVGYGTHRSDPRRPARPAARVGARTPSRGQGHVPGHQALAMLERNGLVESSAALRPARAFTVTREARINPPSHDRRHPSRRWNVFAWEVQVGPPPAAAIGGASRSP